MMEFVAASADHDLAQVFVARLDDGSPIECVEARQPPVPRTEKWVLIISTLRGCPVCCPICDAGGSYSGPLSVAEMWAQIEFLIRRRFPAGAVPVAKLKIQLARMGEPSFNDAVLDLLTVLPDRLSVPGLMPCVSTIAPRSRAAFLHRLAQIKTELYGEGRFQMQFSIHTTCDRQRRSLIPVDTWRLAEIGEFGRRYWRVGDRKITLNFAPAKGMPLNPETLLCAALEPDRFLVKLTPINPTRAALGSGLGSVIQPEHPTRCETVAERFRRSGFETILSIGELEENRIGSNCGMYVNRRQWPGRIDTERTSQSSGQSTSPNIHGPKPVCPEPRAERARRSPS